MARSPSSTDRARAFRLRQKIAKKIPISSEHKEWLEAYENGGSLPRFRAAAPDRKATTEIRASEATVRTEAPWRPIGAPSSPTSSPTSAPPASGARFSVDPDGAATDHDDDDDDERDDDERDDDSGVHESPGAASTSATSHESTVCTIPDCPACAGMLDKGPQICARTKKPVWPQISDNGARMLAGVILFCIGFGVRLAYRQPEIVDPTELELEALADAIKDVVRKRAGWVQAVDDLLSTAWGVGAYAKRARKVKALAPAASGGPS